MNNKPAKKISNKILIPAVIALFAVIAAGILVWNLLETDGDVVVIHRNNEIVEEIDLSEIESPRRIDLGTNELCVEKDGAYMKSAKCPDIICAPNRIMIEFKGKDDKVDAVAGGR